MCCIQWKNGRILFLLLLFLFPLLLLTRPTTAHHVNPSGYWDSSGTPPSNVQHCTYVSSYLNPGDNVVGVNVYTPPGYESNNLDYPVIYALHGLNGDEFNYFSWFNNVYNEPSLLSYIEGTVQADLPIPQAIVVFVNGGAQSYYNNFTDQYHGPGSDFPIMTESMVMNELIPAVDATFRTIASRSGRAIEGFSMGGRGALKFAFKYPQQFCSVVAYAGAVYEALVEPPYKGPLPENERISTMVAENVNDILQLGLQIRLAVGDPDNPQQTTNMILVEQLDDLNIPYVAELSLPGVGHNWADLYAARGEEGLNFHYQCFQAATQASQAPAGSYFTYLPYLARPEENTGNLFLTCE